MKLTIKNIEKLIKMDLSSKWNPYSEGFKVTKIFSQEDNYQIRMENDVKYTHNVVSCTVILHRNPKYGYENLDGNPLYELSIPNSYGIDEDIVLIAKEQLETIDSMCILLAGAIDRMYERLRMVNAIDKMNERLKEERLLDPIKQ